MREPTYLVPRHLLFSVQATGQALEVLRRRHYQAITAGLDQAVVQRRRERVIRAELERDDAILEAAAAGATIAELVGHGVDREAAEQIDQGAWR